VRRKIKLIRHVRPDWRRILIFKRYCSKDPLLSILRFNIFDLPTPPNLSYLYNFGSILGLFLISQIVTGFLIAVHYSCDASFSFSSLSHIIRDVQGGWVLRSMHANGASFFFLALYSHIGRGLYFGSYTKVGV